MTGYGVRRRWASALAAALMGVTLAACGASPQAGGPSGGEPDPAGVLRYGYPLPVAGLHFDPTLSHTPTEIVWMSAVYGTLMRQRDDGTLAPWMAERVEVVDPTSVRVTLRSGVTFTDGAAYDAAAVRTSLLRARTPATPAAKAAQDVGLRALADVEVVDPLTAVARLSEPLAGVFMAELAQRTGAIQSPKQIAEDAGRIDTAPVGAGPFAVAANTPQQLLSLRRNPGFWDAANVRLGGVDLVNTPTGPQQVNGLLAGNLDWAPYVPAEVIDRVGSDPRYATHVATADTVEMLMCPDKAPFDVEAVRQAIQIGVDRERFRQLAFGGVAGTAVSFLREDNPSFAPRTRELLAYDQERAKQLLATTGPVTVDLHFPSTLNLGNPAEALASQLRAIGITVNVTAERDALNGFIVPQKAGALLNATIGSTGYTVFSRHFAPNGRWALCGVDRPDVMALVNRAAGLAPDDPAAIDGYRRAQELVAEKAYAVPLSVFPAISGYDRNRVGGEPRYSVQGYLWFDSVHVLQQGRRP